MRRECRRRPWWTARGGGATRPARALATTTMAPRPAVRATSSPRCSIPQSCFRASTSSPSRRPARSAARSLGCARPREASLGYAHVPSLILWGAQEYTLLVDRERGVLLRLAARDEEGPFRIYEFRSIVFDEPLAAETFTLTPPSGEKVRALEPRHNRPVEVEEAIRRAPCALFVPERAPDGAHLSIMVAPSWRNPSEIRAVMFSYHWTGGTHRATLVETATPQPDADELEDWRELERGGQRLRVRDPGGDDPSGMHPEPKVALEWEGTHIRIATNLELDTAIEMASSLVPLSADPPR